MGFDPISVMAIGSLLMGGVGMVQQQQQAKESKKAVAATQAAAQAAADASKITTEEKKKEVAAALKKREALARARSAASGVSGPSTDIYLSALEKEGADELSYLSKVGDAEYNKTITEGGLSVGRAKSSASSASSAFWGSAGNLVNDFSSANQKYGWI